MCSDWLYANEFILGGGSTGTHMEKKIDGVHVRRYSTEQIANGLHTAGCSLDFRSAVSKKNIHLPSPWPNEASFFNLPENLRQDTKMSGRRALHFVFKVADLTATAKFYREILGMKFLRHEEFEEGCAATCNGPYDGKWSKSMVGYGPEDNHFVTELTYNYGVKSYDLGNDFLGITIQCSNAVANAKKAQWPLTIESEGVWSVQAPGGYRFYLVDKPSPAGDPVQKVAIGVSNLQKSVDYWTSKCGMTLYEQTEKSALLGFGEGQCRLELLDQGEPIDHKTAFGRVAFSCPREQLPGIEAASKDAGENIITPLISLDTPGKATVEVVILGDPDGHEICFVGDEAFRELSQVDPKADGLLDEGVAADKSDEWFAKKKAKQGIQWTPGS